MPERHLRHALAQREGDVLVLTILDAKLETEDVCARLREELMEVVTQSEAKKVVLDFRNVRTVSSVAFRPLLSVRRIMQQSNGRMLLCNLSESVAQMFYATRLLAADRPSAATFQEQSSLEAAIEHLKQEVD
jgi:anti-anti-sigma factor